MKTEKKKERKEMRKCPNCGKEMKKQKIIRYGEKYLAWVCKCGMTLNIKKLEGFDLV